MVFWFKLIIVNIIYIIRRYYSKKKTRPRFRGRIKKNRNNHSGLTAESVERI